MMEEYRMNFLEYNLMLTMSSSTGDSRQCHDVQQVEDYALSLLAIRLNHLEVSSLSFENSHMSVILPNYMNQCDHPPVDNQEQISRGTYANIYSSSPGICAKVFHTEQAFLHETIVADLISIAKEHYREDVKHLSLQTYLGACHICKTIWYPRYMCSLDNFFDLSTQHIPDLSREFLALKDAVEFLNFKCGLFHSDVSADNILVEPMGHPNTIRSLILADVGIGTIHAGNAFKAITVKGRDGGILYNMYNFKTPFLVCKDDVKPLCILRRCYLLRKHSHGIDVMDTGEQMVGQKMAFLIDISALCQVFISMLARVIELTGDCTYDSWLLEIQDNLESTYYLTLLAPKLFMYELLANLWGIDIDVGINSIGVMAHGQLEAPHRALLNRAYEEFKQHFEPLISPSFLQALKNKDLQRTFLNLSELDYFEPRGASQNGHFRQQNTPGRGTQSRNWRAA
ncbi:kinase [Porcine lymphotropic herpesvirus 3]|uniref:Kinase n=1 Tax=Suid gammaherpesvirus 5 TaxID=1960251 RepID=Q8B3Y6_9GAMA|nr:kinase [Porcine lymphotropic herpesvirus 3]AAO12339.1 kinase [Porcine lymphotropic herpesvirus 3]